MKKDYGETGDRASPPERKLRKVFLEKAKSVVAWELFGPTRDVIVCDEKDEMIAKFAFNKKR